MRILLDRDEQYAPGCYLLCLVDYYDGSTSPRDSERTVLIQSDYEYPGLARTFGWEYDTRDCSHTGTDGTVDCPECGTTASELIESAREYLDFCVDDGGKVDDPGYFEHLHPLGGAA